MSRLAVALLIALAAMPAALAATPPRDAEIVAAASAETPAALETLATTLARDCEAGSDVATCYLAGYAHYVLARRQMATPEAAAGPLVACGTALARAQQDAAWKAEADALLTGCWGFAIALNPSKGMSLGPRSAALAEAALAAAPESPRVAFLAASRLHYTPAAFGGDRARSAALVARGFELLEREAAAPNALGLGWGRDELEYLAREQSAR